MDNDHTVSKQRVFVAIQISRVLQKQIVHWENTVLANQTLSNNALHTIRFLKGKNLHVTLIPPWYETDLTPVVMNIKKSSLL